MSFWHFLIVCRDFLFSFFLIIVCMRFDKNPFLLLMFRGNNFSYLAGPASRLSALGFFFFFFLSIFFFLRFYSFMRHTQRGRDTRRGRSRLPTGSPIQNSIPELGSRPEPKADAQPLSHPGVPWFRISLLCPFCAPLLLFPGPSLSFALTFLVGLHLDPPPMRIFSTRGFVLESFESSSGPAEHSSN